MGSVFLNGSFVARDDARVSAFDAGLTHAVGLFETMLGVLDADGARIVGLMDHVQRLAASARELGLTESINARGLADACLATLDRWGMHESGVGTGSRARVRLSVTGGDLNMLQASGQSTHNPTVLIQAQPATAYPDAMFERGVRVTLGSARVNPLDPTSAHKTLSYWMRLRELQAAGARGGAEALMFSVTNHLAGGCVSNVFIVKDGSLRTPIARGEEAATESIRDAHGTVLPSPVLPGVTRAQVMRLADEVGVGVARRMLTIDDVLSADEVFLTNSSWGVLPVVGVEAEAIGGGRPGPVTQRLRARWLGEVNGG